MEVVYSETAVTVNYFLFMDTWKLEMRRVSTVVMGTNIAK